MRLLAGAVVGVGAGYVQDESSGEVVYEGPDAALVPGLVDQWAQALNTERGEPTVDAAMAHLNLVLSHPFRDGNGRWPADCRPW